MKYRGKSRGPFSRQIQWGSINIKSFEVNNKLDKQISDKEMVQFFIQHNFLVACIIEK